MSADPTTRQFFDRRADDYYDSNYEQPSNRHAYNLALRREICLQLLPRIDGSILDLGCGPGAMTIPLMRAGARVISTDLSADMIADTTRRVRTLGLEPAVAIADAVALPFATASFNAVVTLGVLEYVREIRAAMTEIARVLELGGVLIATMSLPRHVERWAVRIAARLRGISSGAKQYIYSRPAFDEIITSAGFAIEARRCCSFAPFPVDAVWPRSVEWIDKTLGGPLNKSELACSLAKTYIVRARRR